MNNHRAHDYRHLIARWRALVPLRRFAQAGKEHLYYFRSPALTAQGGIYLSAGIHGDEPGGTEGLIAWAEKNAAHLASLPLLIFPCLNPWGLINNRRSDETGCDLNRSFHRDDLPVIHALKQVAAPFQFDLALMLHEDFDAQGLYLYEIKTARSAWGESLLTAARRVIPIDQRPKIDGRTSIAGLIRRRFEEKRFAIMGYPEAIWVHRAHARCSLTIETPSEFALEQRVRAHAAVIEESVRRCFPRARR